MASGIVTTAMIKKGGPNLTLALNSQSYLQHPWQRVLYVQSVHTRAVDQNNAGVNPDAPLKTLAKAVVNANAGDMIVVGPNHVEPVNTAAALDISKAGLTIIGLGGDGTRPAILVGGVIGAFAQISGQGVRMSNFQFVPGIDAITKLVNITGAGVRLDGCRIDESATLQSVTGITIASTANGGVISQLVAEQYTAGASQCILISGACTEFDITDCVIRGNYSVGCISVTAAALHLNIGRNVLHNLNTTVGIICGAVAASGMIYNNFISVTGAVAAPFAAMITLGSAIWTLFENYGVDGAGLTGALIGVAAT